MRGDAGHVVLNVPNLLTFGRILLVPVLVWLLLQRAYGSAALVFIAAGLTDALDGFLARWLNQFTKLGALLDPLADKAMVVAAAVALAALGQLPVWLALAVVLRDVVILCGAFAFRRVTGSLEMAPTLPGKAHTALVFVLLSLVMANSAGTADLSPWLPGLFGLALVTTAASGLHYIWVWGRKAAAMARASPDRGPTQGPSPRV